ncbi:MAG TPA: hypothetical protein VFW65_00010 [Pseudonocardiaceae bacterium]|nr:hypothetical protein [Pseudonocardiaceae bacterium]
MDTDDHSVVAGGPDELVGPAELQLSAYLVQRAELGVDVKVRRVVVEVGADPLQPGDLARPKAAARQLHARGDRLVFSNGILLWAGFAIALIVVTRWWQSLPHYQSARRLKPACC